MRVVSVLGSENEEEATVGVMVVSMLLEERMPVVGGGGDSKGRGVLDAEAVMMARGRVWGAPSCFSCSFPSSSSSSSAFLLTPGWMASSEAACREWVCAMWKGANWMLYPLISRRSR